MTKQELTNAQIFLEYIKHMGFDPTKYKRILELGQTPEESMVYFLKKYNPYLLTFISSDKRLEEIGVEGGKGYIQNGKIIYPEKASDVVPLPERVKDKRPYPTIDEFDVLISRGITDKCFASAKLPQDKFFGFCLDQDDKNLNFQARRCHYLLEEINASGQEEYELKKATTKNGKVLYLVKNRNI